MTDGQSLRERAIAAYERHDAERKREEAEREQARRRIRLNEFARRLKDITGLDLVPDGERITVDGIEFRLPERILTGTLLEIGYGCGNCGSQFAAQVSTLEGLGEFLSGRHTCSAEGPISDREEVSPNDFPF